jgi:hypothetical protein
VDESKTYFEDEKYLVTSKRFVIRSSGETFALSRLANPRIEGTPLERGTNVVSSFLNSLFHKWNDWDSFRSTMKLLIDIDGSTRCLECEVYSHPNCTDGPTEHVHGGELHQAHREYYRQLCEAIGAAMAGD